MGKKRAGKRSPPKMEAQGERSSSGSSSASLGLSKVEGSPLLLDDGESPVVETALEEDIEVMEALNEGIGQKRRGSAGGRAGTIWREPRGDGDQNTMYVYGFSSSLDSQSVSSSQRWMGLNILNGWLYSQDNC